MTDDLEPTLVAGTVVGALLLGLYAAWITADLVARWLTFAVVALGAGYVLFSKEDLRGQFSYAAYVLAGLLVLTPIFVFLPDVLSAEAYGVEATGMIFLMANFQLIVLFAIPAAIVAYLGYRVSGGSGVIERIQNARSTQ